MGSDSSHQSKNLTCPDCGTDFSFAVPTDSQVPIPCPECGAATPIEEPTSDAESPGDPDGDENRADATAHGMPGTMGDEETEPGAAASDERDAERDSTVIGISGQERGEAEASDGGSDAGAAGEGESGIIQSRAEQQSSDSHPGVDLDPGEPEEDARPADLTSDAPETFDEGEEEPSADGEDSDEREPRLDPGDRWSTPPPQDAIEKTEEDDHSAVTEEMDSVPEILADADSSGFEEAADPEPAYDTEPKGKSLVEPSESDEGEAVDAAEESPTEGDAAGPGPESGEASEGERDGSTDMGVPSVETPPADDESDDDEREDSGSTELGVPSVETPMAGDETDGDEAGDPGRTELGVGAVDASPQTDEDAPAEETTEATDEESEQLGADGADDESEEESESARDPSPIRTRDQDYRIDPSTEMEIAADEAMARAEEPASKKPLGEAPDDRRDVQELRENIPDESFQVRVENYVYTDIDRTRLARLIADGKVFAIDAIAGEDELWMSPSEHPALEDLRRKSADDAHRVLDAAPESESREIDLDALEGPPDTDEEPPPLPEDSKAAPEPEPPEPEDPERGSDGEEPGEREPPAGRTAEKKSDARSGPPLVTIAALLFLLAGAIVLYSIRKSQQGEPPTTPSASSAARGDEPTAPGSESDDGSGSDSSAEFVEEAVARASGIVGDATDVDPSDAELQKRVADRLRRAEQPGRASRIMDALWRERSDEPSFAREYLKTLFEAERWRRARHVALESMQNLRSRKHFLEKYRETLERDPALQEYRPVDLGELDDVQSIRPTDTGDYPAYVVRDLTGSPLFLFLPEASEVESWRDQIAAWRFCEIVECGFEIPATRAAEIDRETFDRLFEPTSGEGPAPDRSQLEWTDRDGSSVLRGAVRRWPDGLERWPIEALGLWRPWLSEYTGDVSWDATLSEVVENREDLDDNLRGLILETTGDWTVRRTARQLSNTLTFDYLTNNWGRFEEDPASYGASNHASPDSFVTFRSETVFQNRGSRRVEGRFNWCYRFSRDMVQSLRLLRRNRTESILYPAPTPKTEAKVRLFWRQRKRVLNRIDYLIRNHGRPTIIAFE